MGGDCGTARHGGSGTRLTEGLVDVGGLEAHEVGQLVDDDLALGRALVHALDAPPLPVGPVDEVAQEGEAEDVGQLVVHQDPAARPVHAHHLRGGDEEREREWVRQSYHS